MENSFKNTCNACSEDLMGDTWILSDSPKANGQNAHLAGEIYFRDINNWYLKLEFKGFFYDIINNKKYTTYYIWKSYNNAFIKIKEYIAQDHKKISSILQIHKEEFVRGFKTYLNKNKIKEQQYFINFINKLYNFLEIYYNDQPEYERDLWDVRRLGIDYNKSRCDYFINFRGINNPAFRVLAKKYLYMRLLVQSNISWATAKQYSYNLQIFFEFLEIYHPEWNNLNNLMREDIENFIKYLRITPLKQNNKNGNKNPTEHHIYFVMMVVYTFVSYIQIYSWTEAPTQLVNRLINQNDIPKLARKKPDDIKYIPDDIWEQLTNNIDKLPKETIPVILVLEASGFRISDVCMLKMDCLKKQDDGWWIVGNQHKLKELNHKVPISDDIARVILAQQKYIKENCPPEYNKDNYLFPVYKGSRKGLPKSQCAISYILNKLARVCNIKDKNGNIYKFRNHAFRHRYGVNLINNGMNITHIQKLMAHASPEMTMVYAQIHDTTLRNEWEKCKFTGAVKLDSNGKVIKANIDEQSKEHGIELEWIRHNFDSIRLDFGFCIKNPKLKCSYLDQLLEVPCISNNCRNFHVDSSFLDFYNTQIEKMEADIELYTKNERNRSIELIKPKLQKFKDIRDGIIYCSQLQDKGEHTKVEVEGIIYGK
jgi:integrase